MSKFKRPTTKQINAWIKKWQKKLNLEDVVLTWSFHDSATNGDGIARNKRGIVFIDYGLKTIEMRLNKDVEEDINEDLIVHELLHFLTDPTSTFFSRVAAVASNKDEADCLNAAYSVVEDMVIDGLVRILK